MNLRSTDNIPYGINSNFFFLNKSLKHPYVSETEHLEQSGDEVLIAPMKSCKTR